MKLYQTVLFLAAVALSKYSAGETIVNMRGSGFVENKGQLRNQSGKPNPTVLFTKDFGGMKVHLRKTGFCYETYNVKPKWTDPASIPYKMVTITENGDSVISLPGREEAMKNKVYHYHRVDVEMVGANQQATILAAGRMENQSRYLSPENGNESVSPAGFSEVRIRDVYPGIDVLFHSQDESGNFKYDFILKQGADISVIELEYKGAQKLELDPDGMLRISTMYETLSEGIPLCYTENGAGNRIEVPGIKFGLNGNRLKFLGKTPEFTGNLVIDPVIVRCWGTYFGGPGDESASCIKSDPAGNIYVCGNTSSIVNIATSGAYFDSITLTNDGFLAKFANSGNLLWSTYLGGTSANKMDLSSNTIIITGDSICKFDTSGTFYWKINGNKVSNSVALDADGNFVAVGDSVVKYTGNGTRLWGLKYGLSTTHLMDVVIDSTGNCFITGNTYDSSGISTTGSYQPVYQGNCGILSWLYVFGPPYGDACLAKISSNGQILWGTYMGGELGESGTALAIDPEGNIIVTGETNSTVNIATPGACQTANAPNGRGFQRVFLPINGTCDATLPVCGLNVPYCVGITPADVYNAQHPFQMMDGFVMKFSQEGTRLWGSYFGGTWDEFPRAVVTDSASNIIIAGYTSSIGQFIAPNSIYQCPGCITPTQANYSYYFSTFLISFNPEGTSSPWKSDFGFVAPPFVLPGLGKGNFTAGMTLDHDMNLFIAGSTNYTQNFSQIAYGNSFKDSLDGNSDAFIAKLPIFDVVPVQTEYYNPCFGDTLVLLAHEPAQSATPITYQWYKNGIPMTGKDSSCLRINGAEISDSGFYSCEMNRQSCGVFMTPGYHIFPRFSPVFDTIQTGLFNERTFFADMNNDGKLDILGNRSVYFNVNGQLVLSSDTTKINQEFFEVYDVDGDGDEEVLTRTDVFISENNSFTKVSLDANVKCWGDFDNDGDIDGLDLTSSMLIRNDHGQFTKIPVARSYNMWLYPPSLGESADIDNDGDLDAVIFNGRVLKSGYSESGLYYAVWHENKQSVWVERSIDLSPGTTMMTNVSFDLGDYNNDKYPDLAVTFGDAVQYMQQVTQIYRNDAAVFTKIAEFTTPGWPPLWPDHPRIHWADFDNDGDLDAVAKDEIFINSEGVFSKFPSTFSSNISSGIIANYFNSPGDFNNDGYLELSNGPFIFKGDLCNAAVNEKPTSPAVMSVTTSQDSVTIHWSAATDDLTSVDGLTYNLRIGTGLNPDNVMPSNSGSSGLRKIVAPGNVGSHLNWKLWSLPEGNYHASVQSVDNHFIGSAFSEAFNFSIVRPPVILSHFDDRYFCPGDSARLNVQATSIYPLTYQWFKDGNLIPGASGSSLIFPSLELSDSAFYKCKVSNYGYSTITDSIFLEVLPQMSFKTEVTFSYNGAGDTYNGTDGAWLDINQDNQLDLLFNGSAGGTSLSFCYQNNDSVFTNLGWFPPNSAQGHILTDWNRDNIPDFLKPANDNVLISLISGSAFTQVTKYYPDSYLHTFTAGDYDNDGDMDVYISGGTGYWWGTTPISWLLTNVNGEFNADSTALTPLNFGDAKWVDIDNDGDRDIIMCGNPLADNYVTKTLVYKNSNGTFQLNQSDITGKQDGRIEMADIDNDGDQDLLITGRTWLGSAWEVKIYKNIGGWFYDTQILFPSIAWGTNIAVMDIDNDGSTEVSIGDNVYRLLSDQLQFVATIPAGNPGDFNNDGRLDFFKDSRIRRNEDCGMRNTPPSAPQNLAISQDGNKVVFTWDKATDAQTPQNGLTYNIRVGTTSGGSDIVSALADPQTGFRYVVQNGNVQQSLTYYLKGLLPGTYYWSVQAVDNGFLGGPFAPEQSFSFYPQVPEIISIPNDQVGAGETNCYDALQTITVGGGTIGFRVQPGGYATMIAGQNIVFLPSSKVDSSGYLHGYVTTSDEFCFSQMQYGSVVQAVPGDWKPMEEGKDTETDAWLVKVHPNPTTSILHLTLQSTEPSIPVQVKLYNLLGEVVYSKELSCINSCEISLEDKQPGLYLLQVVQGRRSEVVKVVKH